MKRLLAAAALLLLTVTAAGTVWTVGETHRQGCQLENLTRLEVTDASTRDVLGARINLDGNEALTLRSVYPGARPCKRWPL